MAHLSDNRILETSTTTGTGSMTVAGAVTGFLAFSAAERNDGTAIQTNDTFYYAAWAVDANGNATGAFEAGLGTYSGANTVARTTVMRSSNADAAVSWAAGTKYVAITLIGTRTVQLDNVLAATFPVIVTAPGTPAAGFASFFFKETAGIGAPRYRNAQGLDHTLQDTIALNSFEMCNGGIAAPLLLGGAAAPTHTGAASTAAMASTNLATSLVHTIYASTATAGTLATQVSPPLRFWRGNAAELGGFRFVCRFSLLALQTGMRCFMGIADSITALTNVDYTTATTPGKIGMAIVASTGNWNLVHNLTGSAPTIIALGANFAVNVTDVQELMITCATNGATYGYRVRNLNTLNETSGTISTNMPAATTFMAPSLAITNNATAAIASMRFYKWTKEGDN